MPKSNINEVIEKFKQAETRLKNIDFTEALVGGVNAARGKMSFRIFNSTLDEAGIPFGKYVGKKISKKNPLTPYQLKRVKKGRQVLKKDLEFYGDLRRGPKVVVENKARVLCAITNIKLARIAVSQEQQIGKIRGGGRVAIFGLSAEEKRFLIVNTNALIKQLYARAINP